MLAGNKGLNFQLQPGELPVNQNFAERVSLFLLDPVHFWHFFLQRALITAAARTLQAAEAQHRGQMGSS